MPAETTFEVEGMEELIDTIDRMIEGIHPDRIEPALQKSAQIIAKEARSRAPVRKQEQHNRGGRGERKAPGILKRSIKTKKLSRWGKDAAPTIAAIDRKPAAHAWLVVHGTKGKRVVSPPRWVVIAGRPALIDNTGVMPANPFWGDSIKAKQAAALKNIEDAVGKILEEAAR